MDTTAIENQLQTMANEEQMKELRAAVEGANEEAKKAIEDDTLVPEIPAEDPTETEESTEEESVEHVALGGGQKVEFMDPAIEKQKYRNDVLSFMGLTYVSLSARRKSIADNLKTLEENKKYMDEVQKAVADGTATLNDEVLAMNLGQNYDFAHKYESLMAEGAVLTRIIDEINKRFPEEKRKSVSFVSDSMVQSCKAQIATLKEKYPDGSRDLDIKRLENVAEAYACRQDAGPLMNKLSYGHNMINHIKRLRDMDPKDVLDEINLNFSEIFKDKNMGSFRQLLTRLRMESITEHQDDEKTVQLVAVTALFITHWLAHSYQREYKDGRCTYFKTFVMNVYDYYSKDMDFDIPGGREVFKLTAQIIFACFEVAMALVSEKKPFKAAVEEYNKSYIAFGAAYSAQVAQFIGDADSVKTATLVSDFLSEEDADQIADAVYGWLHPLEEEETTHDMDSDAEEAGIPESEEEDGTAEPEAQADEDSSEDEVEREEEAEHSDTVPDDGVPEGEPAREPAVQHSSGSLYTSAVSHRGVGERHQDSPVEGQVERNPGAAASSEGGGCKCPVGPEGEPEVPVITPETSLSEDEVQHHQLPIADGSDDIYDSIHEELAHGDDTPTSTPKPKRTNIN